MAFPLCGRLQPSKPVSSDCSACMCKVQVQVQGVGLKPKS